MLTVETLDYDHACTRVLIRCLSGSRSAKEYAHQTREAEDHAKSRAESTTSSFGVTNSASRLNYEGEGVVS